MRLLVHQIKYFFPLLAFVLLCSFRVTAQVVIPIETKNTALVLQSDTKQNLGIIYFGRKLSQASEYASIPGVYKQSEDYTGVLNSAYTTSGTRNLVEPAITVNHADGNNSLDLKYVEHNVKALDGNVSLITVVLKDPVYAFEVKLF